jgi:hypothetical protein
MCDERYARIAHAIAISPFFAGTRARAESHGFSLTFPFGGQRHYQAMRPAFDKAPVVLFESLDCAIASDWVHDSPRDRERGIRTARPQATLRLANHAFEPFEFLLGEIEVKLGILRFPPRGPHKEKEVC